MKKIVKLSLVLFSLYFIAPQVAMAQSYPVTAGSYPVMAGEKFVSGIANAATGFMELPKNMVMTSQKDGIPYGVTVGLVTGLIHTVGRTVVGAFDVATFFIPTPPSVYPRYIWLDFSRETTYGGLY